MKKILFAASECVPFCKTGGLADVVGSLPKTFDRKEYDVRVILPQYEFMKDEYKSQLKNVVYFQMDNRIYVGINTLTLDGITYYFVDNRQYFSGDKPYYDLFADLERFAYFSKAILSALPLIGFRPDIIHCHDWQVSLVPVYLNTIFQGDDFFRGMRTIMTIHNLRFQGSWNVGHLRWVSALPDSLFEPGLLVSPYQDTSIPKDDWNASMLRGGLVFSDWITTVSESYAREIQTHEFGDGLEDILSWRQNRLMGIVNGIDYSSWDPATDKKIENNYTQKNFLSMREKNKLALQKELGLREDKDAFMIAIVSRLTDQKGMSLIDSIMDRICDKNINFVVLGTGDSYFENMFRYYESKYPDKVRAKIEFSDALSRKIYSASDAFLVPSAFEPCGLTQLISLKYGAIPIVHETGGLRDTVVPFDEFENTGTGLSFYDFTPEVLLGRINYAYYIYTQKRELWVEMQKRALKADWSWKASSKKYQDLYNSL